jgi:hypothetical protein
MVPLAQCVGGCCSAVGNRSFEGGKLVSEAALVTDNLCGSHGQFIWHARTIYGFSDRFGGGRLLSWLVRPGRTW